MFYLFLCLKITQVNVEIEFGRLYIQRLKFENSVFQTQIIDIIL